MLLKWWQNHVADKLEMISRERGTVYDILIKMLIFTILLVSIPLMFSSKKTLKYTDMKVGSIAPKKVVAPYTFYVLKTEDELSDERQKKIQKVPYYFEYDDSLANRQLDILDNLIPLLLKYRDSYREADTSSAFKKNVLLNIKHEIEDRFDIDISTANLNVIMDLLGSQENVNNLRTVMEDMMAYVKVGIMDRLNSTLKRPNVVVLRKGVEEHLPDSNRYDLKYVEETIENKLLKTFNINQTIIINYLLSYVRQPNLIFQEEMTKKAVEQAVSEVSLTKDIVYENERIVDANERIDEEIYQKLYSLEVSKEERSKKEGSWQYELAFLGKMMLVASILLIAGLYLFSYRKKIYRDNSMLLMISLILLIEFAMAAIMTGPLDWPVYVIPTTFASMLIAILVDSGIAFVGTVVLALVLGGIQGGGYDIALLALVSGMVAIYSVHEIRTRNQIFKTILYIALTYLWLMVAITAVRYDSLLEGMRTFSYMLLPNAILAPFVTFMVIGIFEKMFNITTDVTLLELSDLNHPLLKRLSLEAPGTFHHSMVVGNLAESAAKAINANSLLARVGSYYHDIGKMEKPEYFVENQSNSSNRHDGLTPRMSALILAAHVKHGVEMAKSYGIPERIRAFIPEHHGTNLMPYFYNKALEQSDGKTVNESDFRYPGPKPQSKETGIVMLADAVEAATRTIKNPTPNKIRAFVENLVDGRFKEGELDECELTLRDLKNIIDAFMTVLVGVFQQRIEYPDVEKKKKTESKQKAKAESKTEKKAVNGNSNISTG